MKLITKLLISAGLLLIVIGSLNTNDTKKSNHDKEITATIDAVVTAKATPTNTPYEIELSSGEYVAGKDFPVGKYDIIAVSGNGNVQTSDLKVFALMGTADSDLYIKDYKNIEITKDTTVRIDGLSIKLVKK